MAGWRRLIQLTIALYSVNTASPGHERDSAVVIIWLYIQTKLTKNIVKFAIAMDFNPNPYLNPYPCSHFHTYIHTHKAFYTYIQGVLYSADYDNEHRW